jgi:hypothetical protein
MVVFCIGRHFSLDSVMNVPKERSRWRKNKERKMSLKAKVGDWRKSVDVHSMWVVCKRTQTSWIINGAHRERDSEEQWRSIDNVTTRRCRYGGRSRPSWSIDFLRQSCEVQNLIWSASFYKCKIFHLLINDPLLGKKNGKRKPVPVNRLAQE